MNCYHPRQSSHAELYKDEPCTKKELPHQCDSPCSSTLPGKQPLEPRGALPAADCLIIIQMLQIFIDE